MPKIGPIDLVWDVVLQVQVPRWGNISPSGNKALQTQETLKLPYDKDPKVTCIFGDLKRTTNNQSYNHHSHHRQL